jgi:hypothetical protein
MFLRDFHQGKRAPQGSTVSVGTAQIAKQNTSKVGVEPQSQPAVVAAKLPTLGRGNLQIRAARNDQVANGNLHGLTVLI